MTDFTKLPDDELFKMAGTTPKTEFILATMREAESGGDYKAPGGSGERGAYQFMPDTWDKWSREYSKETSGKPQRLAMTKDNQDRVARYAVNSLLSQGHSPEQVFSVWNSGSPKWEGKVGVNAAGQKYDVPGHVKRSKSIYDRLIGALGPSEAQAGNIPQAQSQFVEDQDQEYEQDNPGQNLQSMSDEELASIAGVDLQSMSDDELAKVAGVELPTAAPTKPAELKSAIPETAPEWAKNNPGAYWKIVDGIKQTEILGDVGALTAGAKVGATTGAIGGPILSLLGGVAGAGLAYSMKQQGMDRLKEYLGMKPATGLVDTSIKAATDVAKGSEIEIGGQALGAVAGKAADVAAPAVKSLWGSLTGAGRGAIDEALEAGKSLSWKHPFKSVTDFDRAMRGKMNGQDIVQNALDAVRVVRDKRATEYLDKLGRIRTDSTALSSVRTGLDDELTRLAGADEFQIGINVIPGNVVNGVQQADKIAVDFGQSPLVKNLGVVKKAITDVKTWGDNSAAGLDTLKKRLSKYIDQAETGGPAEAMLTRLESSLSSGLKSAVPEYAEMTAGYAELTKLIKDMEAGLMLRKQGMTGRVYADMTLRRLTSSMKDNFILRRDLVEALGDISGKDLKGQVAGFVMRSPIPLGASGVGSTLVTEALLMKFISPKMWPVLLASSPRVAGEFLRLYGKAYGELSGTGPLAGRTLVDAFMRNRDQFKDFKLENVQPTTEEGDNVNQGSPEPESQSFIRNPIPSPNQEPVRRPIRIGRDKTNGRIVHDYGDGEIVYAA